MKDTIIVQCPACGQWLEIPHLNALERMVFGTIENVGKVQDVIDDSVSNHKLKNLAKKVIGYLHVASGIPLLKGAANAALDSVYHCQCENCGYELSFDDDSHDQREEHKKYLAQLEESERNSNLSILLIEHSADIDINNESEMKTYISDITRRLNIEQDKSLRSKLYSVLALMHWFMEEDDDIVIDLTQKSCNEAEAEEDVEMAVMQSFYYLNKIIIESGEENISQELYRSFPYLLKYQVSDAWCPLADKEYENAFLESKNAYVEHFLALPPIERRFLVFSDKFEVFPKQFFVLPMDMIPKNLDLRGNDGIPKENELYMIHPYKPNTYILAKEYAIGLFRDKVGEFKDIMIRLGAKSLSFSDIQETETNETQHKKHSAEANGKLIGKGELEIGGSIDSTEEQQRKLYNEIAEEGEYALTQFYPSLPDDLVWYPHEERWKKEVQHRLDGKTIKANYTISLNSTESVSKSKQAEIAIGFKAMVGESNVKYSLNEETFNSFRLLHSWKCSVEFYPLSEYQK